MGSITKSSNYQSTYGMTGNGQYGGTSLELIQFPTHNFYPQFLTIKVYCPQLGTQYIAKKTVQILDLDGDDPTCEEYYSYSSFPESEEQYDGSAIYPKTAYSDSDQELSANYKYSKVYTIDGQLLFTGDKNYLDNFSVNTGQLYIVIHYSDSGNVLGVEKKIFF